MEELNDIHILLQSTNHIIRNTREELIKILQNSAIPLIIRADILNEAEQLSRTGLRRNIEDIIPKELLSKEIFSIEDVIELISRGVDCYNLLEYMVLGMYKYIMK